MELIGELVTETLDFDGGREVEVYRPRDTPVGIVFAGDGQLIAGWGEALEAADVPPTMIVGVHRTRAQDEMARLAEYSPVFDSERFDAHEQFFVHDVSEWVRVRFGVTLPAERTMVSGVSASAEFSLAMGLRHPDLFGTVFAASPGAGYRPPEVMPIALPRVYLTAGSGERFFLEHATRWADALRGAGAEVVMTTPKGEHGGAFWKDEFVKMVAWSLGG